MIKAIVFDFDGVLADTYQLNFNLCSLFHENLTEQLFKDHHNGNVFETRKINFTEENEIFFHRKLKEEFTKTHLFDLKDILLNLNEKFLLFIISSNNDDNIKHFLTLDNYHPLFTKVLGSMVHQSKVEKFKLIFEENNLNAENCLFVTDTIGDILEAHKVNVKTIAVTWGYHEKELLMKYKPFAIAHNKNELLEIIEKTCNDIKS